MGTSKRRHTYGSYLALDKLLSCQNTKTNADSELLFIVIHQSNELWFKVLIHELENAIASLYKGDELSAYKVLARASQILLLLTRTWDVLSTLTPNEFRVFRDSVGQDNASGFQSHQYRMVEFLLGLKSRVQALRHERWRKERGRHCDTWQIRYSRADAPPAAEAECV